MKVICDRGALLEAVGDMTRVVPQRTAAPALRCVHLVAGDASLELAATDTEIGLRLAIDKVDIERPGEALVPADKLQEIVRACDEPSISIETDGHQVDIRAGSGHFVLYGMDPAEAASVPDMPPSDDVVFSFTIEAGPFARLVSRSIFAAATESSRYAINGVLFQKADRHLRLVATDGHRLAVADGRPTTMTGEGRAILPVKALTILGRLLAVDEEVVDVRITDSQAFFRVGDQATSPSMSTSLVEGTFPPFEDVIPKDHDKKAVADVEILARGLQQASLYTNKESKGVRMNFGSDKVTLTSRVPEQGEAEVMVDLEYGGDPLTIGFNAGYLTEALRVLGNGQVTLELKADSKPGVIRTGGDFTYVIMPLQLS